MRPNGASSRSRPAFGVPPRQPMSAAGGPRRMPPIAAGLKNSCLSLRPTVRPLAQRLPELYGKPWAGMPFRVDVVETVSYAGADSVNLRDPGLHILASSSNPSNQGRAALEIV